MNAATLEFLCSQNWGSVYSVDYIYGDNWNSFTPATAGIIGFGPSSPIWQIVGNPKTKHFSVEMAAYNDPIWAEPSYVSSGASNFAFNTFNSSGYITADSVSLTANINNFFEMSLFEFGYYNTSNSDEYFESIMNSYTNEGTAYSKWANMSQLELDVRGIALPRTSYLLLTHMLKVITNGQATCMLRHGGVCTMTQDCNFYN